MASSYSLAAAVAIRETLRGQIIAGAADPSIAIYDSADVLLATVTIDPDTSVVDPVTADLSLLVAEQEDSAPASGAASYGRVLDGDGDPVVQLPCAAGSVAVAGYLIINSLSVVASAPVEILSAVFPGGPLIEED